MSILDVAVRLLEVVLLFILLVILALGIAYGFEQKRKNRQIRRDNPLSRNTYQHKDH